MRNNNCNSVNRTIYKRLAEIQLSDLDRQRATCALRDAEALADAVILPRLGFKH